ncbi:MAG: hypothetical protein IKO72_08930 [Kiritimatiellae bacterium]|nr:hypothetical protein [Kiritimatiellia bacterium]
MPVLAAIFAATAISGQGDGAFVSSGFVTALLGTGGIAGILGYLGGRKHRVTVEPTVCEERHKLLASQIENIYARLNTLENNNSEHTAQLRAIERRVESMDGKLDTIIGKIG